MCVCLILPAPLYSARKLVSMCGMLVAHLDGRERAFLLANPNSLKAKLATQAGPLVTYVVNVTMIMFGLKKKIIHI